MTDTLHFILLSLSLCNYSLRNWECKITYALILQVYILKLNCRIYNNDSTIPISDIGENDGALLCVTDFMDCCRRNQTRDKNKALGE